jgi:hypothetical protein
MRRRIRSVAVDLHPGSSLPVQVACSVPTVVLQPETDLALRRPAIPLQHCVGGIHSRCITGRADLLECRSRDLPARRRCPWRRCRRLHETLPPPTPPLRSQAPRRQAARHGRMTAQVPSPAFPPFDQSVPGVGLIRAARQSIMASRCPQPQFAGCVSAPRGRQNAIACIRMPFITKTSTLSEAKRRWPAGAAPGGASAPDAATHAAAAAAANPAFGGGVATAAQVPVQGLGSRVEDYGPRVCLQSQSSARHALWSERSHMVALLSFCAASREGRLASVLG